MIWWALCILLAPPLRAQGSGERLQASDPAEAAARLLAEAAGPELLGTLRSKGYVVLQGADAAPRLRHAHWKALEDLDRLKAAALGLAQAHQRLSSGNADLSLLDGSMDLQGLSLLPPSGLMTPALHTAAAALSAWEAHARELSAKGASEQKLSDALAAATLFETPWGQRFAARTHADAEDDPMPLVRPYFDWALAGVSPLPEAINHFTGYLATRYKAEAAPLLAQDAKKGLSSEELRAWILKYLRDQRRLHALKRLKAGLASLERKAPLAEDLASLAALARVLTEKPKLLKDLKELSAKASPAAPAIRLTSTGLHLQQPTRGRQYEMGDIAVLSGGYWVDGLPEGKSVEVEETTWLEYATETLEVQTARVKRSNGGPYAFSRKVELKDSRGFALRTAIAAAGSNALLEKLWVAPSKDFEAALLKLAEADHQAQSCQFKEADYQRVESAAAEAAQARPQYAALLKTAKLRRAQAEQQAGQLAKLEELISESRADASPQTCRYETSRTEDAIRLAKSLPPGCGRALPELNRQLAVIRRRAADQETYAKLAAMSRAKARSCDSAAAVELAGQALSILDADPGARCAATAADAEKLAQELVVTRGDEFWHWEFQQEIKALESGASPERRLKVLNPLLARLSSLPGADCFVKERREAVALADAAGLDLGGPEFKAAIELLPVDYQLAKTDGEVALERRRLEEAASAVPTQKPDEPSPSIPSQVSPPQTVLPIDVGPDASRDKPRIKPKRKRS